MAKEHQELTAEEIRQQQITQIAEWAINELFPELIEKHTLQLIEEYSGNLPRRKKRVAMLQYIFGNSGCGHQFTINDNELSLYFPHFPCSPEMARDVFDQLVGTQNRTGWLDQNGKKFSCYRSTGQARGEITVGYTALASESLRACRREEREKTCQHVERIQSILDVLGIADLVEFKMGTDPLHPSGGQMVWKNIEAISTLREAMERMKTR